jgi:hypothetical protein
MNTTQILLKKLDSGSLESLAFDLLQREHKDWVNCVHPGKVEGTNKTRKGVPDIYCYTKNENLVYISVTSNSSKNKIFDDVLKSINKLKKNNKVNNSICVAFLNYEPRDDEIVMCKELCKDNNSEFIFYNNSKVSKMLDFYEFQDIRSKYLNIPESNIYTVERFLKRLKKKSNKLPFSNQFIGRNHEIQELMLKVKEGNRVIIIYGKPGVGKTRFSIEFAKNLNSDNRYKEVKILVVDSNMKELKSSIRGEIGNNSNFILVVDNANRFEDLNDIKDLVLNPSTESKPIIILNTRGYGLKSIISRIRSWDIEGIGEFYLSRLSNAEIDKILKGKPFNINSQAQRRNIVTNVKGNPRLAAIMAEALRTGGKINFNEPFSIFRKYYEGVFSELIELLDKSGYHEKNLLTLISALRSINVKDKRLVKKIINYIKFDSEIQFKSAIEKLYDYEIIEIAGSGMTKIFDDGISEYIFFKYCLDDHRPVLSFKSIFKYFKESHSDLIIENLFAVSNKGYKSKEIEKQFKLLLAETSEVLKNSQDKYKKVQYLQWMNRYAYECPTDSYNVISNYWNNYESLVSESEALAIIEICKSIYWKIFKTHSKGVINLLTSIYFSENVDSNKIESAIFETVENLFSYLPPQEANNGKYYWYFRIQEIILNIINGKLKRHIKLKELDLIIHILSLFCYSYFTYNYSDYIDKKKFFLTSGSLEVSTPLKKIRENTYRNLEDIYLKKVNIKQKMKIIDSLKKPFESLVPFRKKISPELRKFDANQILVFLGNICGSEKNLLLKSKFFNLLKLIEKFEKSTKITKLIKVIMDNKLEEYMKISGVYWESIYSNFGYEKIEELKDKFILNFISKINLSNIDRYLSKICGYQELITLGGKNHEIIIGKIFFGLCKENPEIGENIVSLLNANEKFSNLKIYMFNMLAGIAVTKPDVRIKISKRIINKGDLEECRALANSFIYGLERKREDIKILGILLDKKDNIIDRALINALKEYEDIDKNWVKNSLILISKRCSESTFNHLLYEIIPKDNSNYSIYKDDYKTFKNIVFQTIKLDSIEKIEHSLSSCLQYIMNVEGLNGVKEYLLARIRIKSKGKTKSHLRFDDFSYRGFSFINESKGMETFYKELLDNTLDESIRPDVLDLIVGLVGDLKKVEFKDIFIQWADDNRERLKVIVYLLTELKPGDVWFDIANEIIEKDIYSEDMELLRKSFSGIHDMSGSLSDYYKKELESVNRAKGKYESEIMKYFLDLISDYLEENISFQKEKERERDEFY